MAGDRIRQAAALVRNEGARSLVGRVIGRLRSAVFDSGAVVWMHFPTAEALDAEGSGLTMVKVVPGSIEEEHANGLRPLTAIVRDLRLKAGGQRFIFHDGDITDLCFHCWVFRDGAVISDRLGTVMPLPASSAQLEDSYTPPSKRRSNYFVACVNDVCRMLNEQGTASLLTKADEENVAVRRGLGNAGWSEFATVHGRVFLGRFVRWRVETQAPHFEGLKDLDARNR